MTFSYSGATPQFKADITSAQLRNRFTDISTEFNTLNPSTVRFPDTSSASQYQAFLLDATKLAFTTNHILRSNVALSHDDGNGTQYEVLMSDGDGTTSWTPAFRSNVDLEHDAGNGSAGQLLQSDGDGTLSWATTGNLTDGDKGDITVASSGSSWTIDENAVDQANLAWTFSTKTSAYTAVNDDYLFCDTDTTAAFTVTFPASPSAGDKIYINDVKGTFDSANLTIDPNGNNIENQSSNLVLNIKNFSGLYYYVDVSTGWRKL